MAVIKINVSGVVNSKPSAYTAASKVAAVKEDLVDLQWQMDVKIKARKDIEARLRALIQQLSAAEARINGIMAVAESSSMQYQNVDKSLSAQSKAFTQIASLGFIPSGAFGLPGGGFAATASAAGAAVVSNTASPNERLWIGGTTSAALETKTVSLTSAQPGEQTHSNTPAGVAAKAAVASGLGIAPGANASAVGSVGGIGDARGAAGISAASMGAGRTLDEDTDDSESITPRTVVNAFQGAVASGYAAAGIAVDADAEDVAPGKNAQDGRDDR